MAPKPVDIVHYIDVRIADAAKAADTRVMDAQAAMKAESAALAERLQGMNEFRQTITDQAGRFITRAEHEALIRLIDQKMDPLQEFKSEINGRLKTLVAGVSFFGLVVSIAMLYLAFSEHIK